MIIILANHEGHDGVVVGTVETLEQASALQDHWHEEYRLAKEWSRYRLWQKMVRLSKSTDPHPRGTPPLKVAYSGPSACELELIDDEPGDRVLINFTP